ncbi:MAG: aminotransferase class I/II-fold pyridoxal phosphate-dependent enzyme [Chlamydiia bacterium]
MALLNPAFNLEKENIFQEVMKRAKGRDEVVSLAVGDNPGPISGVVLEELVNEALGFANPSGHKGYPPEEGTVELKRWINEVFYQGVFSLEEIFISDGIKTDLFRLQTLFGSRAHSAYFCPGYPTYKEGCQIIGAPVTPIYLEPEKGFNPNCTNLPPFDVFYLCSPNNPTGVALDANQLGQLIEQALYQNGIIVHDACYSPYIQDRNKPKTIFFTPESKKCAIELGSFSKWAAFSGIRLSWAVVPKELQFSDGSSVLKAYTSFLNATYNGVSWLSQQLGVALLKRPHLFEVEVQKTMRRVEKIGSIFRILGFEVVGGEDCPYLLVKSDLDFLEKFGILTLPLNAFDPYYKGFSRVSGFVSEKVLEIVTTRLQNSLEKP